MKRSLGNTFAVSQAVSLLLKSLPLVAQKKVKTATLKDKWTELMGEFVAKRTTKIYIKGSILFLGFDSPALKQDLGYCASEILEKVQSIEKDVKRIFWY